MEKLGRPLRVAVFHSSRSLVGSKASGAGIFEVSLSEVLTRVAKNLPVQFVHYVPGTSRFKHRELGSPQHLIREIRSGFWEQQLSRAPLSLSAGIIEKLGLLRTRNRLRRESIDLVLFTSPSPVALRIGDIPYILTIWDFGHRDLPGFPEVWSRATWLKRELTYSIGVGRASFVVVDSEVTGIRLGQLYGLPREKWSVLGLLTSVPAVNRGKFGVGFPYIVYPSVRWPHKNHVTLYEAFALITQEFPELRLLLSGDTLKAKNGLSQLACDLGISDKVVDLGFLPRTELVSVIEGAQALVMPSLLGPTNIPPLEALQLGVPTVVSNVHDYGEEINQHLVRVPPLKPDSWAAALRKVLNERGKRVKTLPTETDATQIFSRIFESQIDQLAMLSKFLYGSNESR